MIPIAELMQSLKVEKYPPRWNALYGPVMEKFDREGPFFADEAFIRRLNAEYGILGEWEQTVLEAASAVRLLPGLARYIALLQYAMADRDAFPKEMADVAPPLAPDGQDPLAYDFALLFALLPAIPASARTLADRGVPEDIRRRTLGGYADCMDLTRDRYGRPGLYFKRYLIWLQLYIDARLLRIGRLNFEVRRHFDGCVEVFRNENGDYQMLMTGVRLQDGRVFGSPGYQDESRAADADFMETEAYFEGYPVTADGLAAGRRIRLPKGTWRRVLSPEDAVISVHIPAARHGGRLSMQECEQSYRDARDIIGRCYPEANCRAFICNSWMMDPQLAALLPPESSLVRFQRKYRLYPRLSSGQAVFTFIFPKPFKRLEDLPEDSSLQRAVKAHYLSGKYIYEQGGVFF